MQVHSGRGKVQAGGDQVPCHIPVAVRGWPSGGGSQRAERAPFPQRAPGELCRAGPGFSRPGARSRPAPGVIPRVSRAVPSPEAAWDGEAGLVSFGCHLAGKERRFGGGGRAGTEGRGTRSERPAKGGWQTGRVQALHPCMMPHLHLLLLVPFFAPPCWRLSFTGHHIHT